MFPNSLVVVQPRTHGGPIAAAEQSVKSGEIRVLRFERAQRGAETIASDLGINALAQLIVIDEEMPIIISVFAVIAHG
jgi:hypothetical protein